MSENKVAAKGSEEFLKRIRCNSLHARIMDARETIPLFKDGMYLGFSGFAGGNPIVVPNMLADHVENNGLRGCISTASFALSKERLLRMLAECERYRDKIILRPSLISNHAEPIRRLGLIAMNTPVEFDIYGHVNSSIVNGSRIVNGVGGSGDFMRNAYLSIMHAPSTRPTKTDPNGISCVLPMVTHVDHTEHDMDVLVTEQGLADLRGRAPRQRAQRIIDKCAHPEYRPILQEYFGRSLKECLASNSAHQPHMLFKTFNMHRNLLEKGTMKLENWD